MARIRHFLRSAKAAFLLNKAFDAASSRNIQEADHVLRELYGLLGAQPPSSNLLYDVNILFAVISHEMGNNEDARKSIDIASKQIEKETALRIAEKNYLKTFLEAVRCSIDGRADFPEFDEGLIDKVKPSIRRNFPLRRVQQEAID